MEYLAEKITKDQARDIARQCFNVEGEATLLPGEIDFNFRIKSAQGEEYVLKVSRSDIDTSYLEFQQLLLQHVARQGKELLAPRAIEDTQGRAISEYVDVHGKTRRVRLLSWIPGRVWSRVNPQLDDLRFSLGQQCGALTQAMQGFDNPQAHRDFEWDIAQSLWIKAHLHLFPEEQAELIRYFIDLFEQSLESYKTLRKSVVFNDANDNNIIVTEDLIHPKVRALIDYGDAVHTQIINDVAIACAYAIMGHNDPLAAALPVVTGYHTTFPLLEEELEYLYVAIAMRLAVSVTKSALNKVKEPDNTYLLISEKPAWDVLEKWYALNPDFVHFSFRQACGYPAHPNREAFHRWANAQRFTLNDLFPTIPYNDVFQVDLSVSSKWIGHQEEFNDLDFLQFKFERLQSEHPNQVIAGGYLEPRAIYTSSSYDKAGNSGPESRSVHLGVDFWLPKATPVNAVLDGEVVIAANDAGDKEYGGLVVLKHRVEQLEFYSLYGHLSPESATKNQVGELIKKGQHIGVLGDFPENGNWVPHLHFQLMLSLLGYTDDFPGVGYPNQVPVWKDLCPDPNSLFKIPDLEPPQHAGNAELIAYRKKHLGKSLSLQYKVPIKMVRGSGAYLIDDCGRKYLDTVNNVAHVGHENFAVVKAGREQMALLNTNSRYLHENINTLAEELLETLPEELSVLHFVNSGSEANELAIRMAKAATGQRDIIASQVGYHGNTNICVDISSYKFDGKGGSGAPEHTHIFPLPDNFRGKYRGTDAANRYAEEVLKLIEEIQAKGRNVAACIVEPIISCGGQIELPQGFLPLVYEAVRKAGGCCISDEVQVGCGRMGKTFWGFQLYQVVPDIITIGKPLGNGHPLAAVACTREVAEKFANGMEYFNTFGGNPVSCAIGAEVLRTVKRDKLQENALTVGAFLKEELEKLSTDFPIVGDVRGQGLFLGFELVDAQLNPLGDRADYLANRMKDYGILMSTDGPDHNVLKIKPPMVFSVENARELMFYLRKVCAEDFMQLPG